MIKTQKGRLKLIWDKPTWYHLEPSEQISVPRSFARPQADNELKNMVF
jgi:hypothetical protein